VLVVALAVVFVLDPRSVSRGSTLLVARVTDASAFRRHGWTA